jgi:hypothetical protein
MNSVEETIHAVQMESPVTFHNLTIFPIIGRNVQHPDYITLDEALAAGSARVTEISESGSVPELRFVNDSGRAVLLLDGEELVGAKQNRILNVTILVAARQSVVIPVSCVERGRWVSRSREFRSSPHVHYAMGRAMKTASVSHSMHFHGNRHSDQAAIWSDIHAKSLRTHSRSETEAMSAMFTAQSSSLEEFVGGFPIMEHQVGAVFAINGRIAGFDLFDASGTCRKLMPKLIRSYGLDALDSRRSLQTPPPALSTAQQFLEAVANTPKETFDSIGEGQDVRLLGAEIVGAALVAHERIIHLNAFHLTSLEVEERDRA